MICPSCGPKNKMDMLPPSHRCVTCGMEGIVLNCDSCGHPNVDYWQSDGATRQLVNYCPGCGDELGPMRDRQCKAAIAQWPLLKRAYELYSALTEVTCVTCEAKTPLVVEGITAYTRIRPVASEFTAPDPKNPTRLQTVMRSTDMACVCEYCGGLGKHNVDGKVVGQALRMQTWWNLRGKYGNDVAALVASLEAEGQ